MTDDLLTRVIALVRHAGLDYSFLAETYERHALLQGAKISPLVMLSTMVLSLAFDIGLARLLVSPHKRMKQLAWSLIELTRNTPTLMQLCYAFLVINTLITQTLLQWQLASPLIPFFWAVALLSLHRVALHTEALRVGIEAMPPAMLEAAASLDFSTRERL